MRGALPAGLLLAGLLGAPAALDGQPVSERYDLERRASRFDLPGRLSEVSGLAFGPEGSLYAHGDERAMVYRIDPDGETVDRGFAVGEEPARDDFEGLAVAGDRFFLASSRGLLYEFRATAEGGHSPVRVTDTGVGKGCEVEGLAYHAALDALLLACKTTAPPVEEIRVLQIPLAAGGTPSTVVRVPWAAFRARSHDGSVNPSAVEVDPATGTLLLLAARQELLFEIDLQGNLLDLVRLSKDRHPQPEGLAIGPDGRLFIGDEANGKDARLTVYAPRPTSTP